jgi:16S rRNA (cytidine1402-2'-O)-methyltransferase
VSPGRLLVVATPIGNLDDVSPRVCDALSRAELVLAEDTRRTRGLLAHLGLSVPLHSCHRFNEARTLDDAVARMKSGATIALVSDAGTPAISDPGHRLVAAAHEAGVRVEPIAGPSALVAALSASGLPADRFHFAGFLPSKRSARRRELEHLAKLPDTVALFEAPHRLEELLDDALETLGDREAVLARELTKLHEEVLRGTIGTLLASVRARGSVRGECVVVVAGAGEAARELVDEDPGLVALFEEALEREEGDPRRAVRRVARRTGLSRAEVTRRVPAARSKRNQPSDES